MRKNQRNNLIKAAAGAVVTAGIVSSGIWFGHSKVEVLRNKIGELTESAAAYDSNLVPVLCLSGDVHKGLIPCEEELDVVYIPGDAVPEDILSSSKEVAGRALRIDLGRGTYLTEGMLAEAVPAPDERELRYDCIRSGSDVVPGSVIDVRIRYADGTDYIILSGKTVYGVGEEGLLLHVGEEELLLMDGAVTDTACFEDSCIYAAAYVENEFQRRAVVNYVPSQSGIDLIMDDPNITVRSGKHISKEARAEIERRFERIESD